MTPDWNDFITKQITATDNNLVAGVVLRVAGPNGLFDVGSGRVTTTTTPGVFCIRIEGNDGKRNVKQDRYFAASDVLFFGVLVSEVATRLVT